MLDRLSTSIFSGPPGHEIRYNRGTGYLTCSCPQFAFNSKCEYAAEARSILESEGFSVKFRRPVAPLFLKEIELFSESIRSVLEWRGHVTS